MFINKAIIENFMSVGHAEIDFDGRGLVLLIGENHDSAHSSSNGSGKSSIFEAIFWCLYGSTKRGLKADEVVHNLVNNNCMVELYFDDYKVIRGRKHRQYRNDLFVYQMVDGQWKDLTLGTVKDTQALLNNITAFSELSFAKVAHFGQADIKPFASLTNKELQEVFEQSLGFTFLTEHWTKIKAYKAQVGLLKQTVATKKQDIDNKIENMQSKMLVLHNALVEYQNNIINETANLQDQKQSSLQQLKLLEDQLQAQKALVVDTTQLDHLNQKIDSLNAQKQVLLAEYDKQSKQNQKLKTEVEYQFAQLKQLHSEKNNVSSTVGKPCTKCNRPITSDLIDGIVSGLNDQIFDLTMKVDGGKKAVMSGQPTLDQLAKQIVEYSDGIKALEGQKIGLGNVELIRQNRTNLQAQIDHAKKIIAKYDARLLQIASDKPIFGTQIAQCKTAIKEHQEEKLAIERDFVNVSEECQLVDMLDDIFGPSGLKSYLFDNVTPALNMLINKLLSTLDSLEVTVNTQKRLASGEFRDKFDIEIGGTNCGSSYESLSGGEKQKVNFCLSLAFNQLVRQIMPGRLNFIVLDECMEGLDDMGVDRVYEIISNFSETISNTFVVTHNSSLKEAFNQVLCAVKKDGFTTFSWR